MNIERLAGGLGAVARPFGFLEFSGGFRLRDAQKDGIVDPTVPDSYNAKVSLKVLRSALRRFAVTVRSHEFILLRLYRPAKLQIRYQ